MIDRPLLKTGHNQCNFWLRYWTLRIAYCGSRTQLSTPIILRCRETRFFDLGPPLHLFWSSLNFGPRPFVFKNGRDNRFGFFLDFRLPGNKIGCFRECEWWLKCILNYAYIFELSISIKQMCTPPNITMIGVYEEIKRSIYTFIGAEEWVRSQLISVDKLTKFNSRFTCTI